MASSADHQDIVIELVAQFADFVRSAQTATDAVSSHFEKMQGSVQDSVDTTVDGASSRFNEGFATAGAEAANSFVRAFTDIFVAASTVIGADLLGNFLEQQIEKATTLAHGLSRFATELGTTPEAIQRLQYALAGVGVSGDAAEASLRRMSMAIEHAADAHNGRSMIERLGLDPKMLKAEDFNKQILDIGNAIMKLASPTERMTAAMQIFGRYGAADMLTLFSEGADGIKKAEDAADKFGAVLDNKLLAGLKQLHDDMDQAAQTARVFAANLVKPIIEPLDGLIKGIQNLRAEFGKLTETFRTQLTFAGIGGGLAAISAFLVVMSKTSLALPIMHQIEAGLASMIMPIAGVVIAADALWNAWRNDFGGIQELVGDVWLGIEAFINRLIEFFHTASEIIASDLNPALQELSDMIKPITQAFGEWIASMGGSKEVWSTITYWFKVMVDVLASAIKWFAEAPNWMKILVGSLLLVLTPLDDLIFWLGLLLLRGPMIIAFIARFASILSSILAPWLGVIWSALGGLITQLAMAAAAFILVGGAILWVITHWDYMVAGWLEGVSMIDAATAKVLTAISQMDKAIGDLLSHIPGVGGKLSEGFSAAADAAIQQAQRLSTVSANLHLEAQARFKKNPFQETGGDSVSDWWKKVQKEWEDAQKKGKGDAGLKPDASTHGNEVREAIENIKEGLEPFKDAFTDTEERIAELQAQIKLLGTIDTPQKLAEAQRRVAQELKLTNQEREQQIRLAKAAGDAADRLHKLEAAEPNAKLKHEYNRASVSMHSEQHHATTKAIELQVKEAELHKQNIQLIKDYYTNQVEITPTIKARIALLDEEIKKLEKQTGTTKLLAEAHKQVLELQKAQRDAELSKQEAGIKAQIDTITNNQKLAEARSKGLAETPERKRRMEEANAQDAVDTAKLENEANKAKRDAAQQELDAAKANKFTKEEDLLKLTQALRDADENLVNSTAHLNVVQQEQANLQSAGARKLNADFDNLAKEAAGPLYSAFENIRTNLANHMNPTTSILEGAFMALAKDSRAFNDVQKVMTAITEALAKVFDALRPVIDLLLGVLTGVVNMFIGLFNVIASILRIFGIQIQQIQMVNDKLAVLGQGVPLLQIGHDLPTANEYNAGKWGPLVTQQQQQAANNLNNNLTVGFNNQLNRLGQILGEIVAIRLLLAVVGVGSSVKTIFGGGGIGSIFSRLFSNKGGGSASNIGAESFGGWGDNTDKVMNKHLAEGGTADQTLTANLDQNGKLGNTLTGFLAKFGPMLAAAGFGAAKGGLGGGIEGIGGSLLGGMFGRMIGGAAGGPIGSAIAGLLIPAVTSLFGPKYTAQKNPDMLATQQYGQGFADIMGSQQANGQQFTESATALQQTGGSTIGDYISKYISQTGGSGLSAQTIALFKNFQDGMTSLHNGVVTFKNGATGMWSDILNSAQTAMQTIQTNTSFMAQNAANILQGAVSMNLGTSFGNGSVSAVNGGYTVTPGAGLVSSGDFGGGGNSSILINIENVHGADPDALRQAFTPILDDLEARMARRKAQVTRTQRHSYGRTS